MERLLVRPCEVAPTLIGGLETARLVRLESLFAGKNPDKIPPVTLLDRRGVLLTIDGHHRLSQAWMVEMKIWADIYSPGESFVDESGKEVTFNQEVVSKIMKTRWDAMSAGHIGISDLLNDHHRQIFDKLKRLYDL